MEIGEFHALPCELVDMRGLDVGVTVAAHLVVALVVRENEHHVRFVRRSQFQRICEAKQGGQQPPKQFGPDVHGSGF
jgi:hypothetical protein